MNAETKAAEARAALVARYRRLARSLSEFLPESAAEVIRAERDEVQAEIDAIDGNPSRF